MMDLLSLGEWVVIGFLALVVIGPKDLPKVIYSWGRWMARFKTYTEGFREELNGIMRLEHLKTLNSEPEEGGVLFSPEAEISEESSLHPKKSYRSKSLKRR